MRLYNADEPDADRRWQHEDKQVDDAEDDAGCTFFDLRQRTLVGLDQTSAFRIVALGLLRKLRTNSRGAVLYGEVEDALGRYFRLLDADMQKFATLHEALREPAEKGALNPGGSKEAIAASQNAQALLHNGMKEIAAVLLACGEMQKRALDLKMRAQRSISDVRSSAPPVVSFGKFSEFLQEALAVCDQLRRKHEELQQMRLRAMASVVDARMAAAAAAAQSGGSAAKRPNAGAVKGSPTRPKSAEEARMEEAAEAAKHL